MFKRKAIVSLNTFVLLLFLFLLLFTLFYFNYSSKKYDSELLISQKETLIESLNFKSQLIQILSQENSSTIIKANQNKLFYDIILESNQIKFERIEQKDIIQINQTIYINFCANYNISYIQDNAFLFNGTCILLI